MTGSEPSDAVRVVNALLTQLDAIKKYPNVMILTTSNVSGKGHVVFESRGVRRFETRPLCFIFAFSNFMIWSGNVDLAFVDRADIKQYIGPPGPAAIYTILLSCIVELCRVRLVIGESYNSLITVL